MQSDEKVDAVALEGRRQTLALMWKELREHSRQHEAQRAVATNMILVLASADIGIMATIRFGHRTLPLAAGLIVLGVFGYLLSVKHYDRAEWSTAVAVELERRLEELDPNLGIAAAKRAGIPFTPRAFLGCRDCASTKYGRHFTLWWQWRASSP